MNGFTREVLARLPLAEAVLMLLSHVLEAAFLQSLFAAHRGRSYEKTLTFSALVGLMADALLEHAGSGRKSFRAARERAAMPVSDPAGYGKLRRIPVALSVAFLSRTTERIHALFPTPTASPLPASLQGFEVFAHDGKKIKKVAKRLNPLRGVQGTPLGGKALVALWLNRGIAVAMSAHPDGETNDGPLVPELLPQVRALFPDRPRLHVADRQFCDLTQPKRFAAEGDSYLVRYHPKVRFYQDESRAVRAGTDIEGRAYREEWGWLGSPKKRPERLYVRRITLLRPDDEAVILVTNLLDADTYPAGDLLAVYRMRWGIEQMFHQITDVLHLSRLIGSSPQASLFQCAFCLLLYNVIQLIRAHVASGTGRRPEAISTENLFDDVHRELIALHVLGDASTIASAFARPRSPEHVQHRLRERLGALWHQRWLKAPTTRRRRKPDPIPIPGGHTSVFRILEGANDESRQQ